MRVLFLRDSHKSTAWEFYHSLIATGAMLHFFRTKKTSDDKYHTHHLVTNYMKATNTQLPKMRREMQREGHTFRWS